VSPPLIVAALGGNAILRAGERGTLQEQVAHIRTAAVQLAALCAEGSELLLVHGNGPQVGNLLAQQEEARALAPPMPLDVCVALSQGMIGYLLQRELGRIVGRPVTTLLTQVVVDPADPAFDCPTKPVGRFFSADEARALTAGRGWAVGEDAGRGWRRLVPSPRPLRVVELAAIRSLLAAGHLVIACGGGGIPVTPAGEGVEAVIDKDQAALLLAEQLRADALLFLTGVSQVHLDWGKPTQRAVGRLTAAEAEGCLRGGEFGSGSMAPKMEAAARFARSGGRAVVTSLEEACAALRGEAGTAVVPDASDP
jgi:carbamate kinase